MALEIKVLDYGDVEQLESSFLVLGRDCGRPRRVLVLGMLILGGTWPILVDSLLKGQTCDWNDRFRSLCLPGLAIVP
jgi:hypothetical protein